MFKIETAQLKEEIIKKGFVSHMKIPNYCGGNLILTSKRVFFKSEDPEFNEYQLNFPLGKDFKCKSFSLFGFIKNAMRIQIGNKIELFFLDDKEEWIKAIQKEINNVLEKETEI